MVDLKRYWPVIAGVVAFALVLFLLWVIFSDDDSGSSAAAQTCSGVSVAHDVLLDVLAAAGEGNVERVDNGDAVLAYHVVAGEDASVLGVEAAFLVREGPLTPVRPAAPGGQLQLRLHSPGVGGSHPLD
jgi:hypothetical protein